MSLRVAVVGGGPAGSSAAEVLAKAGIETYLFERKLDNAKPCGGAIPLCMVSEFELPPEIIDRKVRKMKMISPSDYEVDIQLDHPDEYIGMCRREILDGFMRERAHQLGAHLINGRVVDIRLPSDPKDLNQPYVIEYYDFSELEPGKKGGGKLSTLEVDVVIGADGAHSKVAEAIDAGDYNYALAFQERIRIPDDKMAYFEDRAEMYVGDDVSPDFYAWVFPKSDHVAVGTGTMHVHQSQIQKLQAGIRTRAAAKIRGGKVIKIEAHPIPEHPRPRRVVGRVALVGDAAGYVTKSSGEGIYFAAKSGRMCGETIVEFSRNGAEVPKEAHLKVYLKRWDRKYGMTYRVLDLLQSIFYRSNATREAFVEMCADRDVQKMTFDSYLYKTVVPMNPLVQLKVTAKTIGSLLRGNGSGPLTDLSLSSLHGSV
ncbi:MAG: geranylgeranyl reductase [Synechococcaceae cyanobacterium SM2_3_1]|nr:geranylgeranyl reductase [Synechococcaceae cyanobacterium SM2_3_1]